MRLFDMNKEQIVATALNNVQLAQSLIGTFKRAGSREQFIKDGVEHCTKAGESHDEAVRFATASADAVDEISKIIGLDLAA